MGQGRAEAATGRFEHESAGQSDGVTSPDRPGPGSESRREALARALRDVWEAAGRPTHDSVAAKVNAATAPGQRRVTDKRIGEWLRGVQVPGQFETLWPVVMELHRRAGLRTPSPAAVNRRAWEALWRAARAERLPAADEPAVPAPAASQAPADPAASEAAPNPTPQRSRARRARGWVAALVVLALVVLALVGAVGWQVLRPDTVVRITSPEDNAGVASALVITGTARLAEGSKLWVMTQAPDGRFYPVGETPTALDESGQWQAAVRLGTGPEGEGMGFRIHAVVTDPGTTHVQEAVDAAREAGRWAGFDVLPPGTRSAASVPVVLEHYVSTG